MEFNPNNKSVENMDINELRKTFSAMGGKATRDWTAEDFRTAISNRQKNGSLLNVVMDENSPPPAGHSRIRLHNNSSGQNFPVQLAVNRYLVKIPRDVLVDVPNEIVHVLKNSYNPNWRSTITKDANGDPVAQKTSTNDLAYPFELVASTPGVALGPGGTPKIKPVVNQEDYRLREKYKEMWGRWPKRAEFKEFKDAHQKAKVGIALNKSNEEMMREMAEQLVKEDQANR